jgi:hypothetical protein
MTPDHPTAPDPDRPAQDEGPADEPRWRSGPDPDAPPWASNDENDDEATREQRQPRPAPGGERDQRGSDAGQDDAEGDESPGGGHESPGTGAGGPTSLAEIAPGMQPPRPPRRTGVFIDPDDLRDYVGGLLRAILGGYEVDAFGNFTFVHEGARVFVTVGASPIGPQVGVFSVTNLELELTPPLGTFLLTTNHRLGFGSFSYDPQNQAVWLRHALLGTTLDGPELQAAVAAIASTAAAMDHEIRDRFGGRTFTEAPSELQRRMEPPEPGHGPAAGGYL